MCRSGSTATGPLATWPASKISTSALFSCVLSRWHDDRARPRKSARRQGRSPARSDTYLRPPRRPRPVRQLVEELPARLAGRRYAQHPELVVGLDRKGAGRSPGSRACGRTPSRGARSASCCLEVDHEPHRAARDHVGEQIGDRLILRIHGRFQLQNIHDQPRAILETIDQVQAVARARRRSRTPRPWTSRGAPECGCPVPAASAAIPSPTRRSRNCRNPSAAGSGRRRRDSS